MKHFYMLFEIVFLIVVSLVSSQKTFLDSKKNIKILRLFKEIVYSLSKSSKIQLPRTFHNVKDPSRQNPVPKYVPFPCNVKEGRSPTVPRSVHHLRPGDIDVIGAMGDSLTAGLGIFSTNIFDLYMENRGASALGGGQGTWREILTIPNILKEFNPNLIGYATQDAFSHQRGSQFNVAESGAMSRDLPFMAKMLIRRMIWDPRVDFNNHWKFISILIGANDICSDMCWIPSAWTSLDNHKIDLIETLRILRDNLPRTMVSIIPVPDLKELASTKGRSQICNITTGFECSCLFGLHWKDERETFFEILKRWREFEQEVTYYPEFQTDTFAVVLQPFSLRTPVPSLPNGLTDFSYFSSDCFHISQITNAKVAYSMWYNMLEPATNKTHFWQDVGTLPCPTSERPYISTLHNTELRNNTIEA